MLQNHHVLHLHGTAEERGFAHGFILAKQIIDFFEFFLLEDRVQSVEVYTTEVFPKLQAGSGTFHFTSEFTLAADGIQGRAGKRVLSAAPSSVALPIFIGFSPSLQLCRDVACWAIYVEFAFDVVWECVFGDHVGAPWLKHSK